MKELGFARKSESFLQIPIKLIIKQHIFKAFALTGRQGDNALIPRVLPWARSFWAFSPCLNNMRKFNELLLNQASYTHV